ncbi:hypothetical protein NIES4101_46310 [Calothrix sp. NIES-4101]|nr:hypothetical protein NIES4101_46310 [Calothrix sp. NIES-4101]
MLTLPQRKFIDNLLIVTDLSKEDERLLYDLNRARQVQLAAIDLVQGKLSASDYLDAVESSVPIDDYLDEICDNVETFLINEYVRR